MPVALSPLTSKIHLLSEQRNRKDINGWSDFAKFQRIEHLVVQSWTQSSHNRDMSRNRRWCWSINLNGDRWIFIADNAWQIVQSDTGERRIGKPPGKYSVFDRFNFASNRKFSPIERKKKKQEEMNFEHFYNNPSHWSVVTVFILTEFITFHRALRKPLALCHKFVNWSYDLLVLFA